MIEGGFQARVDPQVPTDGHYRYERKFVVGELARAEVESILRLHPAAFSEIYQPRWVNNLYFDTAGGQSLWDNLSGVSQVRVKVRIRWYGSFEGEVDLPTLELKVKRGMVIRKVQYPLEAFRMDPSIRIDTVRGLIRKAGIEPSMIHKLLSLELSVANRYQRTYLLSASKKFRATVDSELRFHAIKASGGAFPGTWILAPEGILELKYDEGHELEADRITQHLPFRISRSSKFVLGLELTRRNLGYL